jgi:hypothetical protein
VASHTSNWNNSLSIILLGFKSKIHQISNY